MLDVSAVIVDYHAEDALEQCVDSLVMNGVDDIVVVENGEPGSTPRAVVEKNAMLVEPGVNLGYGRGVNRGAAMTKKSTYLLVSNPDVVVHADCVRQLVEVLAKDPSIGIVGPTIVRPDGSVYPSQRVFPNLWLAAAHALLAPVWKSNPFTKAYRSPRSDGSVDWVSGALFLVRRDVFEKIGGFDERYFMFAEDMALCWQIGRLGYKCVASETARVTHIEGLSRARASRAMLRAHHASALRFEFQTARGLRKLLLPFATLVLGLRLLLVLTFPPKQ